jgi:hypothetical protein
VIDDLIGHLRDDNKNDNPHYQDHQESAHGQEVNKGTPESLFSFVVFSFMTTSISQKKGYKSELTITFYIRHDARQAKSECSLTIYFPFSSQSVMKAFVTSVHDPGRKKTSDNSGGTYDKTENTAVCTPLSHPTPSGPNKAEREALIAECMKRHA